MYGYRRHPRKPPPFIFQFIDKPIPILATLTIITSGSISLARCTPAAHLELIVLYIQNYRYKFHDGLNKRSREHTHIYIYIRHGGERIFMAGSIRGRELIELVVERTRRWPPAESRRRRPGQRQGQRAQRRHSHADLPIDRRDRTCVYTLRVLGYVRFSESVTNSCLLVWAVNYGLIFCFVWAVNQVRSCSPLVLCVSHIPLFVLFVWAKAVDEGVQTERPNWAPKN